MRTFLEILERGGLRCMLSEKRAYELRSFEFKTSYLKKEILFLLVYEVLLFIGVCHIFNPRTGGPIKT